MSVFGDASTKTNERKEGVDSGNVDGARPECVDEGGARQGDKNGHCGNGDVLSFCDDSSEVAILRRGCVDSETDYAGSRPGRGVQGLPTSWA